MCWYMIFKMHIDGLINLITSRMHESNSNGSVCVYIWVCESYFGTTSWVKDYVVHHRAALCTTELCCALFCLRAGMQQ